MSKFITDFVMCEEDRRIQFHYDIIMDFQREIYKDLMKFPGKKKTAALKELFDSIFCDSVMMRRKMKCYRILRALR